MRIRNCCLVVTISLTMAMAWSSPSSGQTEWRVHHTIRLDQPPLDMLVSADKRWIYVLNNQGQIIIYKSSGQVKDRIRVGRDVDQIKAGNQPNQLFLLSKETSTIQTISISLTEEISIKGSPIKGPAEAPITIAVFSDFQ